MEATVVPSSTLKDILELPVSVLRDQQRELIGQDIVDLDRAMRNVYLCADIVATRTVRNAMVPRLRTIPKLNRTCR